MFSNKTAQKGQAIIESLMALIVLGALLHAIVAIAVQSNEGYRAINISRLYAFKKATKTIVDEQRSFQSVDATLPSKAVIGDEIAVQLEKDWLLSHAEIKQVTTQVPDSGAWKHYTLPSSQGVVAITVPAEHPVDQQSTTKMIQKSELGWRNVARHTCMVSRQLTQLMGVSSLSSGLLIDCPLPQENLQYDLNKGSFDAQ
jgi:hypothetical protein